MLPYEQQTTDLINNFRRQIDSLEAQTRPAHTNNTSIEEHTVRVNGRNGASMVNLAPNSDKLVLDQNGPIVWAIVTDGAGYKTIEGYDLTPHKETKQEDVIKSIEDRLSKLEEMMKNGKPNNGPNKPNPKPGYERNDASSRSNDKG